MNAFVPSKIISLGFSMTYYIISEEPEIEIYDALERSWKMMDGKKLELFFLQLRFLPWYAFGLFFFIIGVFIIVPWHNLTLANYYLTIKNEKFTNLKS